MSDIAPLFNSTEFLKTMTISPGVYQMINAKGEIIYVGKAGNLKKRLQSYFRKTETSAKTRSMVLQIANIEVTITHSDVEALLLEHTLIKKHHPKYNVLLRDDKSYPYIVIETEHDYPRISLYRGQKKKHDKFYGPYPSSHAAREAINFLQHVFKIRPCRDSFFRNRSRPCLQYQIKRCSAPCVKYISKEDYQADIRHAEMFLEGKNTSIIQELNQRMIAASSQLEFEYAGMLRDQIAALEAVLEKQSVVTDKKDVDVLYLLRQHDVVVVQIIFIRQGDLVETKSFYPKFPVSASDEEIMSGFLSQYYLQATLKEQWPNEIVISVDCQDKTLLAAGFSEIATKKIKITVNPRTDKKRWLALAKQNAEFAFDKLLSDKGQNEKKLLSLKDALDLAKPPARIECFDISHTLGEATVASCVVFDNQGMQHQQYRRFNITNVARGDDYAAMHQALLRRYQRSVKEEAKLPDLLLIDGGKGQVHEAQKVLQTLQLEKKIVVLGISKGPTRKAGLETLHLVCRQSDKEVPKQSFHLPPDSLALHLLQQIRDEAHRFAIMGHRKQRAKKRQTSPLEEIPGIGLIKRRALMKHFGGLQGLKQASLAEIEKVPGIHKKLAQLIYEFFHEKT